MSLAEIIVLLDTSDTDSVQLFIFFLIASVIVVAITVACFIVYLCCCHSPPLPEAPNRRRGTNYKEHIV